MQLDPRLGEVRPRRRSVDWGMMIWIFYLDFAGHIFCHPGLNREGPRSLANQQRWSLAGVIQWLARMYGYISTAPEHNTTLMSRHIWKFAFVLRSSRCPSLGSSVSSHCRSLGMTSGNGDILARIAELWRGTTWKEQWQTQPQLHLALASLKA
jgi:hypothetical protein